MTIERDYEADARRILKELEGDNAVECMCCAHGPENTAEQEKRAMEEHGWIVHVVKDDSPTGYNAHTHGFDETLKHPDFQIVLPMPPKTAQGIFVDIFEQIKAGKKFPLARPVSGILRDGYKAMFVVAKESDREVWRVILPDNDGNLLKGTVEGVFATQWEGCEELKCE